MAIYEFEMSNSVDSVGFAICTIDWTIGEIIYDGFIDDLLRCELDSGLIGIEPVEIIISQRKKLSKRTDMIIKSYIEGYTARLEIVNFASRRRRSK